MESLDVDGLFWMTSNPEDKVAGRLTYSVDSGVELDLIGSFGGLSTFGKDSGESVPIEGIAGNRLITLDGCLQVGESLEVPGFVRERYDVAFAFVGTHLSVDELVEFVGVHLQLDQLGAWVQKTGTQIERTLSEDGKGIKRFLIAHEPLEKLVDSSHVGELEITFPFHLQHDVFGKISIKQDYEFGIQFKDKPPLEDVLRVCATLQDLVTIGVDAPTVVTKLSLDTVRNKRVQLYGWTRDSHAKAQAKQIHPTRMMFTFGQLGGLNSISAWLKVSDHYKSVTSLLVSHWYQPDLYEENRFLNIVIAAEMLERIRTQEQRVNLKAALKRFAAEVWDVFKSLVDDPDAWAAEIARVRNSQVAHRGLVEEIEGHRLYDLTESLYYLVVFCLLKECGVSADVFSSIQQHRKFRRLALNLRRGNDRS